MENDNFMAVPQNKFAVCLGCRAYGVPLSLDKLCSVCYTLGRKPTTFAPVPLPFAMEGGARTTNQRVVYRDDSVVLAYRSARKRKEKRIVNHGE